MSNIQVIHSNESAIDATRHEIVADIIRGYGATKRYAESLFQYFDNDWFSYEHNDKEPEAQPILEEGKKFRAELKAAGHTNPSVVWTRVRNEGAKMALGEDEAEADAEGDSAGAKQVRTLGLRMIEELSLLYKAGKREESKNNLGAKESQALIGISSALQALGVDTSMLK